MSTQRKNSIKVSFVILHYKTIEDTVRCVSCINSFATEETSIIIVNNDIDILKSEKERLENSDRVTLINTSYNMGFAKGNNIGYQFALENYQSDIIVVLNNDIFIEQKEFMNLLSVLYEEEYFDVLGPNVISLIDGQPQNPVHYDLNSSYKVVRRIVKNYILYFLSFFKLDSKLYKIKIGNHEIKSNKDYQLHGCCLIFSNRYLVENHYAFDPKTFMYCEEDILKYEVMRKNYVMKFDDRITVMHKEGSSTSVAHKNNKSRRFLYINTIRSLNHLLFRYIVRR